MTEPTGPYPPPFPPAAPFPPAPPLRPRRTGRIALIVGGVAVVFLLVVMAGVVGWNVAQSRPVVSVAVAPSPAGDATSASAPSETAEPPAAAPSEAAEPTEEPESPQQAFVRYARAEAGAHGTDEQVLSVGTSMCHLLSEYGGESTREGMLDHDFDQSQITKISAGAVRYLCPENTDELPAMRGESQYNSTSATTYCVIGKGGARLRFGAGVGYDELALIPEGTCGVEAVSGRAEQYGTAKDGHEVLWRYVTWNGHSGWVVSDFLE